MGKNRTRESKKRRKPERENKKRKKTERENKINVK